MFKQSDISCEELLLLYEEKQLTLAQIAELFNCSETSIHRRMKICGIKARPAGGAIEEYPKKDFDGSIYDKAYLIGMRLGDLHVEEGNWAIRIRCTSTRQEQIDLVQELFSEYGGIWISEPREKRGVGITAHLNRLFDFLLRKEDEIEDWILQDNQTFLAFMAGYIDAEGSFIISKDRAYFKIDSGDKGILRQAWDKFLELDVEFPEPNLVRPAGTWISQFQLASRHDLWRLASERKETLLKICIMLAPYLRHQKRVRDMQSVKANVLSRTKRS
jgi:hypothetical protein